LQLLELEPRCLLSYNIIDLGSLMGANVGTSDAYAINNDGYIAGVSDQLVNGNVYGHATLWDPGGTGIHDLHTLISGDAASSAAYAINTSRDVAGSSDVLVNSVVRTHAMRKLVDSNMEDLGTLSGSDYSVAAAINADARVAGTSVFAANPDGDPPPPRKAFYWDGTAMAALTTNDSGTWAEAHAMDNSSNP
jgi:probable HAF family extracellular repeat protein